jgi:hypothetical protein
MTAGRVGCLYWLWNNQPRRLSDRHARGMVNCATVDWLQPWCAHVDRGGDLTTRRHHHPPSRSVFATAIPDSRRCPAAFDRITEVPMSAYLVGLPQRYLRTPEAARFVGLSIRTLEKHRIYGTGPRCSKLGGRDGRTETLAVSPRPQARRPPTWRLAVRLSPSPRQVGKPLAVKRFAFEVCDIARRQPLPGYRLSVERASGGRELLAFAPPSYTQGPVDNLWNRTCFRVPMGTCHQEPDPRDIRNRKPGFPQAVQSLPSRLT